MSDRSFHKPGLLRFSNASHINFIINQFETDTSERSGAVLRELVNHVKDRSLEYVRTVDEIKDDLRTRTKYFDEDDNERSLVEFASETSTDSDFESDNESVDNPSNDVYECPRDVEASYWRWNFVKKSVISLVCVLLCSVWQRLLLSIPRVSFGNLAAVSVLTSVAAPSFISINVVYPCCRLVFGTLYPAYASYKAVRTKNVKEYVKWMMYWIVFALFTCAETFTDVFFNWFPFYYEVKILLVLWLLSPATKGSSILYRKFVHPALCRREQEIDEYISKAKDQGYHTVLNLGTKGVNYATNVIMQTAIKGGGGLVQQLRKSYSLSDLSVSDDRSDRSQQEIDEADDVVGMSEHRVVRRNQPGRGRSPRTMSAPRMDMIFPEVDLGMAPNGRPGGGRDAVNLSHIRSSEDISTAYVPEKSNSQDTLMRTASMGGASRTRSKVIRSTFTSIKRPGAAEDDDEIIIEEMDNDGATSFPFPNFPPLVQPDGTVCLPDSNDIMMQYLRLFMNSQILDKNENIKDDYEKYLKLKEVFESDSKTNSTIGVDSSVEAVPKVDIGITNDKSCLMNDGTVDTTSLTSKVEDKVKEKKHDIAEDKVKEKKLDIAEDKAKEKKHDIAEDKVKEKKHDITEDNVKEKKYNIAEDKVEEKKQDIGLNYFLCTDTNESIDNNKTNTIDKEPNKIDDSKTDTIINKEFFHNEETKSVGASSLSSYDESDNEDFQTPNSSPKMKTKTPNNAKPKKRQAPAPPPPGRKDSQHSVKSDSEIILEDMKSENIKQVDTESVPTTVIPKIIDAIVPSEDKYLKSMEISHGSKNESTLSKLISLPSKISFWASEDSSKNKSLTDNKNTASKVSSDLNNSSADVSGSLPIEIYINLDSKKGDEMEKQEVSSQKNVECVNENLLQTTASLKNLSSNEADKVLNTNNDYIYIPLTIDSLLIRTESKSTDV